MILLIKNGILYNNCTAYHESDNPNKDNLRFTMIHCQTARRDQFEKMAKYNMVPSIFTGHVNYWGDVHMKNFGPVRGNPLKVDPMAIKDIKVLETIKDGETVYAL